MRLRLFRGDSMASAMAMVRASLGANALILNTRKVTGGVEITAAIEPDAEPVAANSERLAALAWHGVPQDLRPGLEHGELAAMIEQTLVFGELPLQQDGCPLMLTGPPGAGKTLTTVRLATRLVLNGVAPMVITTDGVRAGATEQLAAYTRLLGVPLLVANKPASLARALTRRLHGTPVLIDTAAADPREIDQANDLRSLAFGANAHVVLVLPAGLDPAEAAELAIAHADSGATSLIVTRLDLAHRIGGVIAAGAASRLSLAEAGIGTGAVDGLVPLTPSLLAARLSLFGGKNHAT
jgi:flagellar biosynthesis protein FlhF